MNTLNYLALLVVVTGTCLAAGALTLNAQVSVGAEIGTAPACPYGYYDTAPYACSPYGYYGPEWFPGDAFIGAGSWFHGPENFQGHVNNRFDTRHGYKGAAPKVGDRPEPSKRLDKVANFKGNEVRDGHGHVK